MRFSAGVRRGRFRFLLTETTSLQCEGDSIVTNVLHRRGFLRTSLIGGLGAGLVAGRALGKEQTGTNTSSRVAVTAGEDRADIVFRGLSMHRMEGNGPTSGSPVEQRVCVVAPDWLAADRVAVELMGIDFDKIGYLNYCMRANMGQADLNRIEILGEPIARHVRPYRLHDNVQRQLTWMTPPIKS